MKTRQEQIKEAARQRADQYSHPSKWSDTYYGFIDGAKWADSHPHWIPVEEDFKDLDFEVHNFDGAINTMVQESVDNARYVVDDFNHTISMEITITPKQMRNLRKMLRVPKLPRKLKKYVKKTYFDEYPKRMERAMLNFAFAANNPHKARKVGLRVELQKGGES